MKILKRENLRKFVYHRIDKTVRSLLPRAKHVFVNAERILYRDFFAVATKGRISGYRRRHMPRKIYLGQYRNVTFGGEFHDLSHIFLCVKTFYRLAVAAGV